MLYNYAFHDEDKGKWLQEIRKGKVPLLTDDVANVKKMQFKRRDSAEAYCKAINDMWGTHFLIIKIK